MKQSSSAVSPSTLFVLHIRDIAPAAAKTHSDVTLLSGTVLRVPTADIQDFRLSFLRTALAQAATQPKAAQGATDSGALSLSELASAIREKCAKEWPDDFRMRAYCEEQQTNSVSALRARSMTSADELTIRRKCAEDWPDDFRMRDYCEEQQLKALRRVR